MTFLDDLCSPSTANFGGFFYNYNCIIKCFPPNHAKFWSVVLMKLSFGFRRLIRTTHYSTFISFVFFRAWQPLLSVWCHCLCKSCKKIFPFVFPRRKKFEITWEWEMTEFSYLHTHATDHDIKRNGLIC